MEEGVWTLMDHVKPSHQPHQLVEIRPKTQPRQVEVEMGLFQGVQEGDCHQPETLLSADTQIKLLYKTTKTLLVIVYDTLQKTVQK